MAKIDASHFISSLKRKSIMEEGKYVYCIIQNGKYIDFGPIGIGERGDKLDTVVYKDISAVVSDSPIKTYSTSRVNFMAHEKAIEKVMENYDVIPVRFCTITENEEEIMKILEMEYDKFKSLLNWISGKKELGVKAIFEKDMIYNHIVEKFKDIKALKEKLSPLPFEKTRPQIVQIGRMVEVALEKEKEIFKKKILAALSPLAVQVKDNNTYGERMIINSAYLIEKNNEDEFDKRINELDKEFGNIIRFKYVGTLPPFNFVNLIIQTKGL